MPNKLENKWNQMSRHFPSPTCKPPNPKGWPNDSLDLMRLDSKPLANILDHADGISSSNYLARCSLKYQSETKHNSCLHNLG